MTNQKLCDRCKKPIEKGNDYIKLQKITHTGKQLQYLGVGHLCLVCFEEISK